MFHHLGLAVRKPEPAMAFLKFQGYELGSPIFDPHQNINARLCTHAVEPSVEIIWPADKSVGPIDRLVQRNESGIIYHVCYATQDLKVSLETLHAAGVKVICIAPPAPAPLFGTGQVSFYNLLGFGLVEILEIR
jgi:methylmalonyl-CoA/ethylmalonyl-CoA epimerase